MIDYLISNQVRQIWINLELYFKIYKVSNFMNFSSIILFFYEFIWICFELKRIKKSNFYRVLSWQLTYRRQIDVATWQHTNTPCGARICICALVCVQVCACMCACVYTCVYVFVHVCM